VFNRRVSSVFKEWVNTILNGIGPIHFFIVHCGRAHSQHHVFERFHSVFDGKVNFVFKGTRSNSMIIGNENC
jgi:hypothetical protein